MRSYRKSRRGSLRRYKYSVEQTSFSGEVTGGLNQANITIVPPSPQQGMRKVKHLTIQLSTRATNATTGAVDAYPFYYALVYVPQGTSANQLNTTVTYGNLTGQSDDPSTFLVANLYNPNQFVMSCGYIDPNAGPIRISSPIGRNLNSGDYIALCIQLPNTNAVSGFQVAGMVQYAICYS